MAHVIATAGLRGCLPNFVDHGEDMEVMIDAMLKMHDIYPATEEYSRMADELRSSGFVELDFLEHGNEYIEIEICTCENPEIHAES